jgi:hypothetical protein
MGGRRNQSKARRVGPLGRRFKSKNILSGLVRIQSVLYSWLNTCIMQLWIWLGWGMWLYCGSERASEPNFSFSRLAASLKQLPPPSCLTNNLPTGPPLPGAKFFIKYSVSSYKVGGQPAAPSWSKFETDDSRYRSSLRAWRAAFGNCGRASVLGNKVDPKGQGSS